MCIFNRFPYSSTHEMNLDFMLGKATEIAESLQEIDTHKEQAEQAAQAAQAAQTAAQAAQTAAQTSAGQAAQHKSDAEDAADRAEAASNLADEAVEQAQAAAQTAGTAAQNASTAAQNASTAADGAIASATAAETRINTLAASLPEDFTELNTEVYNMKNSYWNHLEANYHADNTRQLYKYKFETGKKYAITNTTSTPCTFVIATASGGGLTTIGTISNGTLIYTATLDGDYVRVQGTGDVTVPFTIDELNTIEQDVTQIKYSTLDELFENGSAAFKIIGDNDITFVKNQLWCSTIVSDTETKIHRIEYYNGKFIRIADITTNFGHLNTLDYNSENDCLIFGNGGNNNEVSNNWFAVVKNPLSLPNNATLTEHAIVYNVDVGFKVQAVWGDSNLGANDIVILVSNNSRTITIIQLLKDATGNFNGQYRTLKTLTRETEIGVGGMTYHNGCLYIGDGSNYSVHKISMTNLEDTIWTRELYNPSGTPYIGSTQGVHIDNKYFWWFSNIQGTTDRWVTRFYR